MEEDGEVVALLPGSRISELHYLAGPVVHAARWLSRHRPGLRFVVPLVNQVTEDHFRSVLARGSSDLAITIVRGQARVAMAAADVVLAASGTATLEAMLLRRPMVITYRTAPLTYWIMKAMLKVKYVGLPNLLAERPLVAELLQHDAVPEKLGAAVLDLLDRPDRQSELRGEYQKIATALRRDASERAAEAVLGLSGN